MHTQIIVQIITIVALAIILYRMYEKNEGLCVKKSYGIVTDVPASNYIDANTALTDTTTLGDKPLGNPKYWKGPQSPITQGQWSLYLDPIPIEETQPFDRSSLTPIYSILPEY